MSYILDALRKSDRERSLGSIRKLETPERTVGAPVSIAVVVLVTVLLMLVMMLAAGGWFYRDALQALLVADSPRPGFESRSPLTLGQPESDMVVDSTVVLDPEPVPEPTLRPETRLEPAPEAAGVQAPVGEVRQDEPVDRARLPAGVLASLPPLKISVLSYSEQDERRFAMIDERIYREGDPLPGGLRVERILRDRILLSGPSGRFHIKP